MNIYFQPWLCAILLVAVSSFNILAAEDQTDVPPRLANGTVIEGTVQEATPDGLIIQGEKGKYTAPWRYLSAGTRYRYELPMLVSEAEATRDKDLKKLPATTPGAAGTNVTGVVSKTPPAGK